MTMMIRWHVAPSAISPMPGATTAPPGVTEPRLRPRERFIGR
jgi:hypothetical protein